jgi:ABC-type antimicrobial peptide transport system permease subunit
VSPRRSAFTWLLLVHQLPPRPTSLLAVTALAGYVAARRAARADPADLLRA